MICVKYDSDKLRMEITGHAKSAPYGQDLVCAAVSTLICTLAEAVKQLYIYRLTDDFELEVEEGNALIRCKPDDHIKFAVAAIFETFFLGMMMLAQQYPDYVQCERLVKSCE